MDSVSDEAQQLYESMLADASKAWSQKELETMVDAEHRGMLVQYIQDLLNQQAIKLLQSEGTLYYQAVSRDEADKIRGMSRDEAIVYSYIQGAGREGIWTKTIRLKSNLHQSVVNRCLKTLETKRFIKSVKSVKFPTRKIVMLYHLQPSIDVTGGPWFTDTELDSEFIALLLRLVWQYVVQATFPENMGHVDPEKQKSHLPDFQNYPSLDDIHSFVAQSGISTVELGLTDIISLCDVLIYDDKLERTANGRYKATWTSMLQEGGVDPIRVPTLPDFRTFGS